MDFGTAIKTCFNKYAVFEGRASRSEYWFFTLFAVISGIVVYFVSMAIVAGSSHDFGAVEFFLLLPTIWQFVIGIPH